MNQEVEGRGEVTMQNRRVQFNSSLHKMEFQRIVFIFCNEYIWSVYKSQRILNVVLHIKIYESFF